MLEKSEIRYEGGAKSQDISGRLEKIMELKEALKHVRGVSEEMSLLSDLTHEISALRQLRELHY
jgi:hypothetical protein